MPEKYYLSPTEQLVMDAAKDMSIIFAEDLIGSLRELNSQSVRNALHTLAGKGGLYRVKRGVYLRCESPGNPVIEDPSRLALAIFKGYIAFSSALRHWGLTEYEPFTIFVVTRDKSGTREIGEYTLKAVSMGAKAQGMTYDRGVYVSTLEKTVFDCIYKPRFSGGYRVVADAVAESDPDWKEVVRWFDRLGSQSLRQRGGYVLSKAGNAPKRALNHLRTGAKHKVWLDPSGKRKGRYIKEWKLIDNVEGWHERR
jgi:predicted transcriptional regulator of viral defense system